MSRPETAITTDIGFHIKQLKRLVGELAIESKVFGQTTTREDIATFIAQLNLETGLKMYLEGMFGLENGQAPS